MRRASLIALCLLLVLPAAPALAKKKHKKSKSLGPVVTATATGNVVSTSGPVSTAVATCPSGKQAVGGGFTVPSTGTNVLFAVTSFRSSPQAWTVSALRTSGSGSATAFAYCRNQSRSIVETTGAGSVPSGGGLIGSATASCPAGSRLVSGGFEIGHGPAIGQFAVPTTNRTTTPGAWTVVAVNNSTGANAITTHAYCMSGIAAPRLVSTTNAPNLTVGAAATVSSPSCPAAKKKKGKKKKGKKKPAQLLTAGGFDGPSTVPIPVAFDSRIASGTWLTSAVNVTGPTGSTPITSQGICV